MRWNQEDIPQTVQTADSPTSDARRPFFIRVREPSPDVMTSTSPPSRVDSFSQHPDARISRASSEPTAPLDPVVTLCPHCTSVDSTNEGSRHLMTHLVSTCYEFENVIRQRFNNDRCICYPNYVTEAEVVG